MALYTFAYTEIPIPPSAPFPNGQTAYRPYLVAQLVAATGQTVNCFVCLDTGADHCVFPLSFAIALGLDPLQMPMHMTGGVGSVANSTYYAPITVNMVIAGGPTMTFQALAGFTAGLEAQGIGLLGQSGFFESFVVAFNHASRAFSIDVP